MLCPSEKCGSSNVEHLPHYWLSLPAESPLRARYAQPDAVDGRVRLVLVAVAVAGLALAVTGSVAFGLLAFAVGAVGGWVVSGRMAAADHARGQWAATQICLACTHRWVP